jgi:hypothetical protein
VPRSKARPEEARTCRSRRPRNVAPKRTQVVRRLADGLSRRAIVACALVGALGFTTVLLAILSPRPLAPDISGRLFATGQESRSLDFEPVFQTRVPPRQDFWTGILVRSSGTPAGDAASLAEQVRSHGTAGVPDHFVIGNGQGMGDGEIQFTSRWAEQVPAGFASNQRLIVICVVGEGAAERPTGAQSARLRALTEALCSRLEIPRERIVVRRGPRPG